MPIKKQLFDIALSFVGHDDGGDVTILARNYYC